MKTYSSDFYKNIQIDSRQSAREIVPLVLELIPCKQVIDVGCGIGSWLSVFQEFEVESIFGVDGEWVDEKMLEIPPEVFRSFDLTKPFSMDRKFDLVVSLEVAEHLPHESAKQFVDSLVSLGPVILFSAAIPFQGGTNHINEQWPHYWLKLFQERGYVGIDCLRKKVWE